MVQAIVGMVLQPESLKIQNACNYHEIKKSVTGTVIIDLVAAVVRLAIGADAGQFSS